MVGEARLEEDSERQVGLLRNKGVESMKEWICKARQCSIECLECFDL